MAEATAQSQRTEGGTPHPAADGAREREQSPSRPEGEGHREGRELIEAAARSANGGGDKLSTEEQVDALEWFLSDTDSTDLTHTFEINVGSVAHKRWVKWTVKPVDMDRLRRIRRASQASQTRRQRAQGTGEFDEVAANVQIVVEGTVSPDLKAAARDLNAVDPAVVVRARFAHKPGLLAQVAGEIMSVSGYDDEDVREVDAARG